MTGAVKVNKILKWLFGLVAVCIVAVVGFLSWVSHELLYDPICDNWHAGMTKEEKIMLVLEAANREPGLTFEFTSEENNKKFKSWAKQFPYPDVASILKENPHCCKLVSKETVDAKNPSEDVSLGDEGVLMVRYKGHYVSSNRKLKQALAVFNKDLNICKK